jgi:hypothetical protein
MCWSLCPYESVTPNACSWRSLTRIGSEEKKQHLLNILSSTAGNKQAEARTQKGAEEQYRRVDHRKIQRAQLQARLCSNRCCSERTRKRCTAVGFSVSAALHLESQLARHLESDSAASRRYVLHAAHGSNLPSAAQSGWCALRSCSA